MPSFGCANFTQICHMAFLGGKGLRLLSYLITRLVVVFKCEIGSPIIFRQRNNQTKGSVLVILKDLQRGNVLLTSTKTTTL